MDSPEINNFKTTAWQKKLLPYMIGILIGLTIFFFIASLVQIFYIHSRIERSPKINLEPALSMLDDATGSEKLDYSMWKTLAMLEVNAVQRRYHQANMLLMSRIWKKYLGFVTGMILVLVGATFILGKLRETESKLDATSSLWKFSLTTASPGLLLALLGTILMLTTMLTHHKITTSDVPLYTNVVFSTSNGKKKDIRSKRDTGRESGEDLREQIKKRLEELKSKKN